LKYNIFHQCLLVVKKCDIARPDPQSFSTKDFKFHKLCESQGAEHQISRKVMCNAI